MSETGFIEPPKVKTIHTKDNIIGPIIWISVYIAVYISYKFYNIHSVINKNKIIRLF